MSKTAGDPKTKPSKKPSGAAMERLLEIMTRLRDTESGCPWDVEQTFATIAPYTIEEAYEVAEAIEQKDLAALKEELGDLLLQVVFHAQMAREAGAFDFAAVAEAIGEKMVRRHPHVFGTTEVADADAQTRIWEEHKADERRIKAAQGGRASVGTLDGVPLALPALLRAMKLQRRAAQVGFDWPRIEPVVGKIEEELEEVRAAAHEGGDSGWIESEIGDLLFAAVNLARWLGADPEAALRRTNAKFERRFRYVEEGLARAGRTPAEATLEEMDALWESAKRGVLEEFTKKYD